MLKFEYLYNGYINVYSSDVQNHPTTFIMHDNDEKEETVRETCLRWMEAFGFKDQDYILESKYQIDVD